LSVEVFCFKIFATKTVDVRQLAMIIFWQSYSV
jgi:hypothetical protein